MKAGGLLCLLSLCVCSGCIDLSKPKAVAECASSGVCSDQQTGGAMGGETAAEGGAGGNIGGMVGSGGTAGGSGATGGVIGSGGSLVAGGATGRGGSVGAGGVTGLGGGSAVGGAAGAGGVAAAGGSTVGASGGTSSGGVVSAGGDTGSGGASSAGGASGTGGVTGSGGSTSSGGVVGTGGAIGSGGAIGTGGKSGTGGSTVTGCGTTKSTVSQTFDFATDLQALSLGPNSTSGSVKHVTAGPSAKPSLCSATSGCAALSVPFSSAAAYAAYALAVENFAPAINLVGSTVTFSLAVDNPAQVPIQIQAYAQGDVTATYAWTQPATVGGASLLAYSAASGFKDLALPVTNYVSTTGKYCAAVTAAVGIQVQNTAAITSSNAGTVTVYISKITVTPPP
jgi:hypothetical protein